MTTNGRHLTEGLYRGFMQFDDQIEQFLKSGAKCHLVGIGGVSMSALAEILFGMGVCVTGSDVNDSSAVENLRSLGIDVKIGHSAENVVGADCVVRTAAAREDNIEIQSARELGIPLFERAQAWGAIMRGYKNAVCVSGVHGKTTTTSMITHILLAAETDPTVMIGGTLPILGSGYRVGKGDVIALESCEYYNSYHSFFPTVAVVLNVDEDHLDFFRDIEDLKDSFRKFASLVPEGGYIICNGDDNNTMEALTPLGRELFTFGFSEGATVRGVNLQAEGKSPAVDVTYDNKHFCSLTLRVPGLQNLSNALAAAAAAIALGIPAKAIEEGLFSYTGAGRRMEYKGKINGADVYDDYAHHPSELRATLDAVDTLGYKRVILAFQPHTYSRTRALFPEFVKVLSKPDITFLAHIYAAREKNDITVSSEKLAEAVPGARCCDTFSQLAEEIAAVAREGDIVLTAGAGDIYKVGETLVESSDDGSDEYDPNKDTLADDCPDDEPSDEADTTASAKIKSRVTLTDSAYNKLLPFSLLAALIGVIIGPIPLLAGIFIGERVLLPLFIVTPLLTHLINKLLKGGRDIRALIVNAVFSLAGVYITALACQATFYLIMNELPLSQLPILIGLQFGSIESLPAVSTLIYPLIFTILGIAMSWELMRGSRMVKRIIIDEPAVENELINEEESTDDGEEAINDNEEFTNEDDSATKDEVINKHD